MDELGYAPMLHKDASTKILCVFEVMRVRCVFLAVGIIHICSATAMLAFAGSMARRPFLVCYSTHSGDTFLHSCEETGSVQMQGFMLLEGILSALLAFMAALEAAGFAYMVDERPWVPWVAHIVTSSFTVFSILVIVVGGHLTHVSVLFGLAAVLVVERVQADSQPYGYVSRALTRDGTPTLVRSVLCSLAVAPSIISFGVAANKESVAGTSRAMFIFACIFQQVVLLEAHITKRLGWAPHLVACNIAITDCVFKLVLRLLLAAAASDV